MRLSKRTVTVLISMLLLSILMAYLVNVLSANSTDSESQTKDNYLRISDSNEHLIWFLQISDTHLSAFRDPLRTTDLRDFCCRTVEAIKPSVVLASGDLTDSRTLDMIGSQQSEKEWQNYRSLLNDCRVEDNTIWLDIRGNHDTFNVAGVDSKYNYFAKYSMQGRGHPRSYMHQVTRGGEKYSFMAIDASLDWGPKMPFNFAGHLDQREIDDVNNLVAETRASGSNHTVWFGHFPTSCILNIGNQSVRELIRSDPKSLVYLCGHLHTVGGLVPRMYTLQKAGFLELELADWKKNRMYRLVAIDHGMLSFADVAHGEWPVGLVTNPKHALFVNTGKENLDNIKASTHVRVLAFSLNEITAVRIRIDGGHWMDLDHVDGPLYVLKWNPERYHSGLHTIDLHVKDGHGREKYNSQPFVMDDSRLSFGLLGRFLLTTDTRTVFMTAFVVTLVVCVSPLIVLRLLQKMVEAKKMSLPRMGGSCCRRWLRKFWILTAVDRIFWPAVLYPVYLSFGPWSVGYVVEDHVGAIFAWGIVVNGSFLPGSFTYILGAIHLVTFQVPLTLILAHGVDYSFRNKILNARKPNTIRGRVCLHLPFFFMLGTHVAMAGIFWSAHGTLAFIFGPLRTWSVLLAAILWYNVVNLPEICTRRVARMLELVPSSEGNPTSDEARRKD